MAVASITGVTLGEGRGVGVIASVLVGRGVIVCVGEEVAVEVEVDGAAVDVARGGDITETALVGLALKAVEVSVSEVSEGIVPVGVELASKVGVLTVKVTCGDGKVD